MKKDIPSIQELNEADKDYFNLLELNPTNYREVNSFIPIDYKDYTTKIGIAEIKKMKKKIRKSYPWLKFIQIEL